jgi:hypothetical protein
MGGVVQVRNVGKTLVTRSSGMRVATDYLKGRIVEANLADLNKDEDQNYRKMQLQILVGCAFRCCPFRPAPPAICFLSRGLRAPQLIGRAAATLAPDWVGCRCTARRCFER